MEHKIKDMTTTTTTMTDDDFDPFGLKNEKSKQLSRPVLVDVVGSSNKAEESTCLDASLFDPFGIAISFERKSSFQEEEQDDNESDQEPTIRKIIKQNMDSSIDNMSTFSPPGPPVVSRVTRSIASNSTRQQSQPQQFTISLPPKLTVKLKIHEEVSSFARKNREGASDVSVQGIISAQVQCSDAKRNAPFYLDTSMIQNDSLIMKMNTNYISNGINENESTKDENNSLILIPKHEIGFIKVASYHLNKTVQHMPLLLERKITVNGSSCRVAVQVRSKLSNVGDITDFSLAVAVPEHVDARSILILRGEGVWDELRRTIKWTRSHLKRGESFMVSAQTALLDGFTKDELHFPIMLRCTSTTDQISHEDFRVVKAISQPSSITCHKSYSFLLLHRLP